ncbi:hypothetical protein [Hyphococcus luteus]|uniref:Uncharacterized protein n=1 Tax=Hyphococcus luteus TaxID=2058213 RepID=A0A2S7K4J9_9PROT|nr:hypothetical protein [Marinicaulis flavus]PQA87406.1 hypothetical protein CW354_12390 [Marinicaulis flavus]PQA87549.1 hypothetical protein CW354_12185 [Marinicaulis flavus]
MGWSAPPAQRIEHDIQQHPVRPRENPHRRPADLYLNRRAVITVKTARTPRTITIFAPRLVAGVIIHNDLNKIFTPRAAAMVTFGIPLMVGMRSITGQNQMPQSGNSSMRQ